MAPGGTALGGIDLGGTKIGVSVGDAAGVVLAADRLDTDHTRAPDELLAAACARLDALAREAGAGGLAGLDAVGVACPGPLSYAERRMLEVPNMPRWQFFELGAWLDGLPVPADFMNDANAGVLAEVSWGAARGAQSAVFLTMSTGMGAGLWLGGRVYEGPRALAGEVGHLRLAADGPVGFGKRGSVEGYLSGPGIVQVAAAELRIALQNGTETALGDAELTPERVCGLARAGDPAALAVVDRCGAELGHLCAMLADLLDPEVIVLGTIGSAAFDLWEPRATAAMEREAIRGVGGRVVLRPSGLTRRGDQTALAVARRVLETRPDLHHRDP